MLLELAKPLASIENKKKPGANPGFFPGKMEKLSNLRRGETVRIELHLPDRPRLASAGTK